MTTLQNKLPTEYPFTEAFKIYARRFTGLILVASLNVLLLGIARIATGLHFDGFVMVGLATSFSLILFIFQQHSNQKVQPLEEVTLDPSETEPAIEDTGKASRLLFILHDELGESAQFMGRREALDQLADILQSHHKSQLVILSSVSGHEKSVLTSAEVNNSDVLPETVRKSEQESEGEVFLNDLDKNLRIWQRIIPIGEELVDLTKAEKLKVELEEAKNKINQLENRLRALERNP